MQGVDDDIGGCTLQGVEDFNVHSTNVCSRLMSKRRLPCSQKSLCKGDGVMLAERLQQVKGSGLSGKLVVKGIHRQGSGTDGVNLDTGLHCSH